MGGNHGTMDHRTDVAGGLRWRITTLRSSSSHRTSEPRPRQTANWAPLRWAASKKSLSQATFTMANWATATTRTDAHRYRLVNRPRPSTEVRSARALKTLNSWASTNVVQAIVAATAGPYRW